jgi:hypothetical protein
MAAAEINSPARTGMSASFNGSTGFVASSPLMHSSRHSPPAARLPRMGAEPGGGTIRLQDRNFLEAFREEVQPIKAGAARDATQRPSVVGKNRSRTVDEADPALQTASDGFGGTQWVAGSSSESASPTGAKHPENPEERRRADLLSKWEKVEAQRAKDLKHLKHRVEERKQLREERFGRLLEEVGGQGGLALQVAQQIRYLEAHQESRKQELYSAWDEKIGQPLALQVFNQVNPADRALHQRLHGSKSVSFSLPEHQFRAIVTVSEDPTRQPVVDHARENAFHQAASSVLGRSQSSPTLFQTRSMYLDMKNGNPSPVVPRALSRPVLEPTEWGQEKLQATPYGHLAQICEHGPGFSRCKRGGHNLFIPDESDGVLAAGTRKSRQYGHHDKGILRGDCGSQGETSEFRTLNGASSGAPAQDHFTYHTGPDITNLEFPSGKRVFAEFH